MKSLMLLAGLVSAMVFGASAVSTDGAYELNKRSAVDRKHSSGTKLYDAQQFGAKAQWSYSALGGAANSVIQLRDHEGNPVKLPNNAIIRDCLIDIVEPVAGTAAGDTTGRIGFSISEAYDLKALSTLKGAGYQAQARIACVPVGTVATMIKLESEGALSMQISSEALTAGKLNLWVEYTLSD